GNGRALPKRTDKNTRDLSHLEAGSAVLLVEDESMVAMMVEETLAELGFCVIGPYGTLAEAMRGKQRSSRCGHPRYQSWRSIGLSSRRSPVLEGRARRVCHRLRDGKYRDPLYRHPAPAKAARQKNAPRSVRYLRQPRACRRDGRAVPSKSRR